MSEDSNSLASQMQTFGIILGAERLTPVLRFIAIRPAFRFGSNNQASYACELKDVGNPFVQGADVPWSSL